MRIDGKKLANEILTDLAQKVSDLKTHNIIPHLIVILAGDDPASLSYVRQKKKKGEEIGAKVTIINYPVDITTEELAKKVKELNLDRGVHGIIIQQPLPKHIDVDHLTELTDPQKDVDGFHSKTNFTEPIALAVIEILKTVSNEKNILEWLKEKNITILGKGETGGLPIINSLKKHNIHFNLIDSKTQNPKQILKKSDLVISCVGKKNIIIKDDLKEGVILLSIGMHKEEDDRLHADYEEEEIEQIASFYTPVPGGVGPVNVAMLLSNLINAATNSL